MLLIFEDEHKEHLSFLSSVSTDVVAEFCKLSLEFMKKGINPKVYNTAAQKLQVEPETIQHGVEGIMYLFTESSKLMLNETDFIESIMTLGFEEELRQVLYSAYQEHRGDIRGILAEMCMDLPHYHNLEWRFDVQLASRSLRHQVTPLVLLRLHLKKGEQTETKILQTDPVNLIHLTNTLEEALNELKTGHCRRLLRNL